MDQMPFFPPEASTMAPRVDALFAIELAMSVAIVLLVLALVVGFAIAFRRRSEDEVPPPRQNHYGLEAAWSVAILVILLGFFAWGAAVYVQMKRPADNALEIHVLGKQWMWKIEHPDGIREIDQLHVPVGQPVKLIMTSQDVIHDFYVPAFRMKQDVLPGCYVTEWFTATRPGTYHLFCSQYCGTDHSRMVGSVVVLNPSDYAKWRAGLVPAESPAAVGQRLFTTYGCITCHGQRAPTMAGLYMSKQLMADGTTVIADDDYLRESILYSNAKIVAGYPPIMPSFRGQLSEEQIADIIAYIKSLSTALAMPGAGPTTSIASQEPTSQPTAPPPPPRGENSPQLLPNFPPARQPPVVQPAPPEIQPR